MTLKEEITYMLYEDSDLVGFEIEDKLEKVCKDFAVAFSKWLLVYCDYKNHCVFEYKGVEYTQKELVGKYLKDVNFGYNAS